MHIILCKRERIKSPAAHVLLKRHDAYEKLRYLADSNCLLISRTSKKKKKKKLRKKIKKNHNRTPEDKLILILIKYKFEILINDIILSL